MMRKLRLSLIISFVFLFTSTSAFLLKAQESRDWTGASGRVVLKSGVLDVDRTLRDMQEGVPTKVYVRDDSGLKYLRYAGISEEDRDYVVQQLETPVDADEKTAAEEQSVGDSSESKRSSSSSPDWTGDFEAGTRKTMTYNGVEFAFRYCPVGTFTMSNPVNEELWWDVDRIQKSVTISEGFWICETETTQAQWDAVGVKKENECRFKGETLPVETVSWNESDEFIEKLNATGLAPAGWRFALPTEEQWEYACRAGTTDSTCGIPLDEAAWFGENFDSGTTHAVGTKTPNKWGLYDMLGNVSEWTNSEYEGYLAFVYCGGGWDYVSCDPTFRGVVDPTSWIDDIGFRCVLVRQSSWTGDFEAGTRKTLTYKGVEFAFRYCPVGTFTMGSPEDEEQRDDDETQKSVTIGDGFWISETETTQAQWDAVGVKKENECRFKGKTLPVETVSWNESAAFIQSLNATGLAPAGWRFALPTEEQWEYACRAGTTGSTYGVPLAEAAWYGAWFWKTTRAIGTKTPNKWGLYDMLGNVWEWTDSKCCDGSSFVIRGGGWDFNARFCRPADRDCYDSTNCGDNLGFRCVLVRSRSK